MRVRVFKIWQIVKFYLFKSLKKIHKSLKHTSKHISHYSSPIFAKVPKSYRQYIRPYVYPIYRRTLGPIIKFVLKLISHIYKKIRRLLKSHKFKAHARFIKLGFEAVILVAVIVGGYKYITRPNYNISSSAQKIIGTPDISLASKFVSYSKADKSYYLNKKAIGQKAKANTIQVGSTSQATYSYKAPVDISRSEMTFYDNTNNLSFSITPSFKTASGKYKNGEFIYPMSKGQQAVYSIKDNGVKEDIILNKNLGDKTSLDFKLNLPDTLSAKLMPSGAIGIYSASPMLLGNVSASSSSDQALLKKARTSSAKDTLQFVLMPPTVASSQNSDKEKERAKTKAQFALNGNNLTIKASGLSKLTYPISIDPTVVVSSALTSGNNESNANITGSSITTNSLTGGSIGSWTSASTFAGGMPARINFGTAVYNGYIYVIGGVAAASSGDCTATNYNCNGTWYSKISNPGATGPSDSPVATPLPNLFQPSVVVYNSFIYVLAGCTSITNSTKWCNGGFNQTIYYAPITTDGTLGTWSIVGGITTSQTFGASAVAWDGSIYVISGCNATATTKSCSGGFNHDFQVSLNNSTGAPMGYTADIYSTLTSVWGATSVIYNGYLYVIGGCKVDTPIVASELCATSSSQSGTTDLIQSVALPAGGGNVGIAYTSQTNKLSKAVFMATSVVYNNKLYVIGGCVGSSTTGNSNECGTSNAGILKDVQYASFTSNSTIGTFTDNTVALPTGLFGASAVVNNGYLYVIGGCTAISNVATYAGCGAISNSIYYTPLSNFSSSTTLTQTNNLSSGLWGFGAVIVNGYVLTIAGCSANATASAIGCGAITNTYQKIKINNGGSGGLISCTGSASSPYCDSNMNYATSNSITGSTSTIYNGKLYIIGGLATTSLGNMSSQCLSSSYLTSNVPSSTDSASASVASIICDQVNVYNILSNGGLSFQNSFPMNLGKYNATVLAYNNKLYVIGGISCFEFIDCSSNESWTADDIQMASISSDGSLGSFTDATPVTGWVSAKNSPSICTTLLLNAVCVNYGSPYSQYLNKTGNYTSYSDSTNYSKGDVVYYANDKAPADNGYYACIASGCGNIPSSSFWLKICSPNSLKYNCSNTTLGYLFGSVASNDTLNNSTLGSAAIYNNYLFITSSFGTNDYSVLVNSDGTLSSTASNTLVNQNSASSNDYMGRTTYNGYTYSIGGIFAARNQIAYAPLNNNGTYGTWKTQFTNYIYGLNKATVFGYNGYMYIVGGNANSRSQYCSSGSCSLVQVAPIFSDGSLGDFQSAGTLPSNSSYNNLFASVYNGNLYVPGTTNIFYSGLTSINHNAVYSYTLDSLSSVTPYGVTVSGGSLSPTGLYVGKSDDMVTIRSEDANCLGAASNIMPSLGSYFGYSIPSTNNTCSNKSTARYHLISANINDTNLFVFPGSSGAYNPSTITGFTLYYHPNSGSRLHGGSDGASGSALPYTSGVQNLQVLDTPR